MTSHPYGPQNWGEGGISEDWSDPPQLEAFSTSFGLPGNGVPNSDFLPDFANAPDFLATGASSSAPLASMPMVSAPMQAVPAVDTGFVSPGLMGQPSPISTGPTSFTAPLAFVPQPSPTSQHAGERSQYSPDVVEAATVLHTGNHNRNYSLQSEPSFSHGTQQRQNHPSMGLPSQHLRHQDSEEFQQDNRRMSQSAHAAPPNGMFCQWSFGGGAAQPDTRPLQTTAPTDLKYGTDESFNNGNQRFQPQSKRDTSQAMDEHQKRCMNNAIALSRSNDATPVPGSLFNGHGASLGHLKTRNPPKALSIDAHSYEGRGLRKKGFGVDDDVDDDEEPESATSKASGRKRKSKVDASLESPGAEAGAAGSGKRRKSAAAAKRENLTEDQKRENHINSEKKRRKVISTGFDNLGHIVPAVRGGNASKSAVLESTVLFLQELLEGNEKLRQTLP